MKLLIKQRVFSWTDSYGIYDENKDAEIIYNEYMNFRLQ